MYVYWSGNINPTFHCLNDSHLAIMYNSFLCNYRHLQAVCTLSSCAVWSCPWQYSGCRRSVSTTLMSQHSLFIAVHLPLLACTLSITEDLPRLTLSNDSWLCPHQSTLPTQMKSSQCLPFVCICRPLHWVSCGFGTGLWDVETAGTPVMSGILDACVFPRGYATYWQMGKPSREVGRWTKTASSTLGHRAFSEAVLLWWIEKNDGEVWKTALLPSVWDNSSSESHIPRVGLNHYRDRTPCSSDCPVCISYVHI